MPCYNVQKTKGDIIKNMLFKVKYLKKFLITNNEENTADEKKAVKELISAQKKTIFITSAYHIYRTKRLFAK